MGLTTRAMDTLVQKIKSLPVDRVTEVEDFVDFLKTKTTTDKEKKPDSSPFPVISIKKWPSNMQLNRDSMYGEDGR